jgi:hypothetical protein
VTTTADALEVMTIVAACHRRTAPRMDDREATLATASVWAELFTVYRLDLADLIAGVKKRALANPDAPEPAEIIHFARDIRRERDAKTGPTAEYEALCESKAAYDDDPLLEANRRRLDAIVDNVADQKGIDDDA